MSLPLALALLACTLPQGDDTSSALDAVYRRLDVRWTPATPDRTDRIDVRAHRCAALDVFERIAARTGLHLHVEESLDALHLHTPLEARIEQRPLVSALRLLGGAAGLLAELDDGRLVLRPEDPETMDPASLMVRALEMTTDTLLGDPEHEDAPRLRFEIANLRYGLGEYEEAAREYEAVLATDSAFEGAALASLRLGHARHLSGDGTGALTAWLDLVESRPYDVLVPAAYLACARSFLDDGDHANASRAVRRVVETWSGPLAPERIHEAASLLAELGEAERAGRAWQRVLALEPTPDLRRLARRGRTRCFAQREEHDRVVQEVAAALGEDPQGEGAAELYLHLARAQVASDEPGLALLALEQAATLPCGDELRARLELERGRLWSACGLWRRALPALEASVRSPIAEIAVEALREHARCAYEAGHYETARGDWRELERRFPELGVEARLQQARVALEQRDHRAVRELLRTTLPQARRPEDRKALLELAARLDVPSADIPGAADAGKELPR